MKGALETFLRWKDYSGRATRTEFWMYVLWSYIAVIAGFIAFDLIVEVTGSPPSGVIHIISAALFLLLLLATALAHLAVAVRRLHDIGISGWWLLLSLIPIVSLGILICFCIDSEVGENRFGPNPKFNDELAATFG